MLVHGSRLKSLAAACFLLASGCTGVRIGQPVNSFVPPAPRAMPVLAPPETATLPQRDLHAELARAPRPPVVDASLSGPPWVGTLLRQADWHMQLGRRALEQGDADRARREFDRALDVLLAPRESASPAAESRIRNKIEELVEAIHSHDVELLSAADPGDDQAAEKAPLDEIPRLTFPIDPAFKNQIHEELRVTCSQLPLEAPDPVLAYIRYFSSGKGRRILIYGLKRAGRYRSMIQRILDEEGLPQELIHVAQAESGFSPRAVSRRRATGMWQFIKSRGQEYGLEQTPYTDDRRDPEKATRAAARHLRDLYHQFGDWYLALAAYNAGPLAVQRAVERTGYADFWELYKRNVLPRETSHYVPIILAMIIMAKNPAAHGLEGIETDAPIEYDTIEMTAPAGLGLVADLLDRPVAELRELNPALLKDVAPTGYLLKVPKGSGQHLAALLEGIPAERRLGMRAHRVAEGETLTSIARRYRVAERSLAAVNGALVDGLQPGDILLVPVGQGATTEPAARTRMPARRQSTGRATAGARAVKRTTVARVPTASGRAAARP